MRRAFFDTPDAAAEELVRWIHTHESLVQMLDTAIQNVADLEQRDLYCRREAVRIFMPVVDEAVAQYEEQMGGVRQQTYPQDIRYMTAELLCDEYEQQEPNQYSDVDVVNDIDVLDDDAVEPVEKPVIEHPAPQPKIVTVQDHEVEVVDEPGQQIIINIQARRNARRQRNMRNRFNRTAKETANQPGLVSSTLRRRMGNALADLFDAFGPEIYSDVVLGLKEMLIQTFTEGFNGLEAAIKEELGSRGVKESQQHIRTWASEIVESINHYGLDEVSGALEDHVGSLASEYVQQDPDDEVLDVGDDDVEELDVVEEEEVEPVDEEDVGVEGEPEIPELDLDDVEVPEIDLGASLGYRRVRGRGPTKTRRTARRSRCGNCG